MHLAERGGGSRMMFELGKFLLPVESKLGAHPAFDEGPSHGRRLTLQLHQLIRVFRRQGIRNGGEQLSHLHDRALQSTERGGELKRVSGAIEPHAEKTRAGKSRGSSAELCADLRIAACAGGKSVLFTVGHERWIPRALPILA